VTITEPSSPAAEAYRSLRTAVQFIGLDQTIRAIQVTSPNSSEGKTTTLANLAVALSRAGQRVIVASCDLRRPRIHEFLGLADKDALKPLGEDLLGPLDEEFVGQPDTNHFGELGLTSVLVGRVPLAEGIEEALRVVPGEESLALLPAGPAPPNPSELLSSKRTAELFDLLKAKCDVLLVDSPPVLPVTDALVLAKLVDATILVGTADRTTRKEIHRSVELLHQVDAPLVGTVLNGVNPEATYGYGAGYGYGYASTGLVGNGTRQGTNALSVNGRNGSRQNNGARTGNHFVSKWLRSRPARR
jgi:non-specific protein-tyrosine kinase